MKRKDEIFVLATIAILLGMMMVSPFTLVFAQQDKTQECQKKHADIISRIQQWLVKRQSFTGQLDLMAQLKQS